MSGAGSAGEGAATMYGVSAGLDLVSGVFGYLDSLSAASVASSQADLIRTEAEANAQRYQEQAAQAQAKEKVMYLSSGVTLAGSPVDALATSARVANENVAAILMQGDAQALNEQVSGANSEMQGRAALTGGLGKAATATGMGIFAAQGGATPGGATPGGATLPASVMYDGAMT